jgi:hypothetical protein
MAALEGVWRPGEKDKHTDWPFFAAERPQEHFAGHRFRKQARESLA